MKKSQLIDLLNQIPGDPEIFIAKNDLGPRKIEFVGQVRTGYNGKFFVSNPRAIGRAWVVSQDYSRYAAGDFQPEITLFLKPKQ